MKIGTTTLILVLAVLSGIAGFVVSRMLAAPEATDSTGGGLTRAEVGSPIPPFTLPDVHGEPVASEDLIGKPLLINFWATWCAPCRREMPELMAFHEELDGEGAVIGIALDEPEAVAAFVEELGIEYPILVAGDLDGTRLVQAYGNRNVLLPYSVFVDSNGLISDVVLGEVDREMARERLR